MASDAENDNLNAQLTDMTTIQLKQELKKRKLKTTGLKSELIQRLLPFMQLEREQGETEPHDDDEDENDDESAGGRQEDGSENNTSSSNEDEVPITERRRNKGRARGNQLLTFRDVEESLETFNGDDKVDVRVWIRDFEEMATLSEWSDVQK